MKKKESFALPVVAFSMGIVLGFLLSPAKNGFGNNTTNTTNNYYGKKSSTDNK